MVMVTVITGSGNTGIGGRRGTIVGDGLDVGDGVVVIISAGLYGTVSGRGRT